MSEAHRVRASSSATDFFLAIDQGGQSTRVAIYSHTGEQICCYASACATTHHQPDASPYVHIEQNGEEILAGIVDCLQKIQGDLGQAVTRIKAAGFAGQGSSLLCWNNQTGAALTPVISWQDIRGEPYLSSLPFTHQQAQQLTGLRLSPHYGATKMRWCLTHNEHVAQAQEHNCLSIGPIVSYIFWHLLGKQHLVDPGHAQRTLLWDLQRNEWSDSLLELFKIPRVVLPQCKLHNSQFGSLHLAGHVTPFTASARDQGASLFARGLPAADTVYVNMGTGAFIQRLSDTLHAPAGLLVSPLWLPEAGQKYYAWEATVNGAASAIPFLQAQTGLEITAQEINDALALNPSDSVYFLNAVGGLGAPYWRTELQSQCSPGLSAQEKILCWIESIVFQIVINLQLMNALGVAKKIIISGGLSKADAVCQKIADLTSLPVHRSDNTDATLQGIACMAAGLPHSWNPDLKEDVFTQRHDALLLRRFATWQQAMERWLLLTEQDTL